MVHIKSRKKQKKDVMDDDILGYIRL